MGGALGGPAPRAAPAEPRARAALAACRCRHCRRIHLLQPHTPAHPCTPSSCTMERWWPARRLIWRRRRPCRRRSSPRRPACRRCATPTSSPSTASPCCTTGERGAEGRAGGVVAGAAGLAQGHRRPPSASSVLSHASTSAMPHACHLRSHPPSLLTSQGHRNHGAGRGAGPALCAAGAWVAIGS